MVEVASLMAGEELCNRKSYKVGVRRSGQRDRDDGRERHHLIKLRDNRQGSRKTHTS